MIFTYLTLSVHVREGYTSHFLSVSLFDCLFVTLTVRLSVCLSVSGYGGLLALQAETNLNWSSLSFATFWKFDIVLKKNKKTEPFESTLDHTLNGKVFSHNTRIITCLAMCLSRHVWCNSFSCEALHCRKSVASCYC